MATSQKVSQEKLNEKKLTRLETTGTSMYAVVHKPQVDSRYPTNLDGSPKRPVYRITVKYPSATDPALKELKANLRAYGIRKKLREVVDTEGNETGELTFTFDRTAFTDEDTGNYTNPPIVVDRYNRPLSKDTMVGNGSKVKVVYNARKSKGPEGGHVLQLVGVQVIDLVSYTPPPLFTPIDSMPGDDEDQDGSIPTSF